MATRTIVHPYLDVANIKDVAYLTCSLCKKQAQRAVQRHPIFISDKYHDYISDEIEQ